MRRRSGSAAWLAVLALGWAACSEEGHPIRVESIDLAEGDYYELNWGGTQEERFYAVARRGAPDGEYVVVSPEHEEPCSLGDDIAGILALKPLNAGKYVVRSPAPALLELYGLAGPDNWRTLSFADVDCARSDVTFDIPAGGNLSSPVRLFEEDLTKMKYLHITRESAAEYVDPRSGDRSTIAEVTNIWGRETNAWLAEDGTWVKRDFEGKELARHGTDVAGLTLLGDSGDVVYQKNNPNGPQFTNADGGDLILVRNHREKKLAELGCKALPADALLPGAIAYFAPCNESRLNLQRNDGKTFSYEAGVSDSIITMQGRLFFQIDRETTTEIWMVQASNLERATKQVDLPRWAGGPRVWNGRAGAVYVAATLMDNSINIWKLMLSGSQANFQLVGEDIQSFTQAEQGTARLQTDGTLLLTDANNTGVVFRAKGKVSEFGLVFGPYQAALVYRTDVDPDTYLGHLQLQFFSGAHFDIDDNVRAFAEVWWPERGILYSTGGPAPKLRFARAEIPCQAMSSAPWACNF